MFPGSFVFLYRYSLSTACATRPNRWAAPIEEHRNDYSGAKTQRADTNTMTLSQLLFGYVLRNKFIWILSFAYFFVYVVRIGINDWTAMFLAAEKGYSLIGANGFVSIFEAGGFCGGLSAGWLSDRAFDARRGPVNVLFACAMVLATLLFWSIPEGYALLDSAAIFMIGFAVFGPQMLIGVAAAELVDKKAAATSNGFAGCFAYMGAASAGYPLSLIVQGWGWDAFFMVLAGCSIVAALLLIPLWNIKTTTDEKPNLIEEEEALVAVDIS